MVSYMVRGDHHALQEMVACDAPDVLQCIQKNIKESVRKYAHLMHYSGPAATEQMMMDGSC